MKNSGSHGRNPLFIGRDHCQGPEQHFDATLHLVLQTRGKAALPADHDAGQLAVKAVRPELLVMRPAPGAATRKVRAVTLERSRILEKNC
jgi:hypothetical protein